MDERDPDLPARVNRAARIDRWSDGVILWEARLCTVALSIHLGLGIWTLAVIGCVFPIIYFTGKAAR